MHPWIVHTIMDEPLLLIDSLQLVILSNLVPGNLSLGNLHAYRPLRFPQSVTFISSTKRTSLLRPMSFPLYVEPDSGASRSLDDFLGSAIYVPVTSLPVAKSRFAL